MRLSARVAANVDFVLVCGIWGSTWLAIKIGLGSMPPATSAALRFIAAGLLLLAVALATRRAWPTGTAFRTQVAVQAVTLAINYFLIYWAEQTVPSGLTAVLFASFAIFTGVIAGLIFRMEEFTGVNALGLALGFVGLSIIFWSEVVLAARTPWQGMAAVVLSALVAAIGSTSLKRWGSDIPALLIAGPSQLACGLLLGALALLIDHGRSMTFGFPAIASIAYLTVFGSAVAFLAWYQLLRLVPATRASLIVYVTPIVAVCLGALVAHERLGLRTLIGAALVFASIGLMHVKRATPAVELA